MKPRARIVLSRRWPKRIESILKEDYEVWPNAPDQAMSAAAMRQALRRADGFCPTVTDRLDADVLRVPSPRTRIVANFGVGFEHIDLNAAPPAPESWSPTQPDVLTDCTADLAMALMLAAARGVVGGDRRLRAGDWAGWRPTHIPGVRGQRQDPGPGGLRPYRTGRGAAGGAGIPHARACP